jgi:hypothetical protein
MAKIRVANHGKHETVVFTCGPPLNMDEIDIKIQYYSTDHNHIKQLPCLLRVTPNIIPLTGFI